LPGRLNAAKQLCTKHGAEITASFMIMGSHAMMALLPAPNDEASCQKRAGARLRGQRPDHHAEAFSEAEYRQIIRTLG